MGKWVFALSFLWTYMFFSQFMLIWYADIPEEITYFQARINDYPVIYWLIFFTNFAIPMLFLMDADAKKNRNLLILVGGIVFVFHWLDVFIMISPGAMKAEAGVGLIEVESFLLFLGVFTFIVSKSLASRPLLVKNHPYLEKGKAIKTERDDDGNILYQVETPGSTGFLLLCNKICGASHYNMKVFIEVVEEKEFNRWLADQKAFESAD